MKLSDDMTEKLISTPMTNCENISEDTSLKSGKTSIEENSNSCLSNGQNGINVSTENLSNGKVSPDPTANHDLNQDLIGFEVESYNGTDSPFSLETHSEIDLDKEGSKNRLIISKCVSEEHDSSHASDEFNLRLSDDEDGNEVAAPRTQQALENETVSSTTEDSCDLLTHEDSSKSSSGSERISFPCGSLPSDTSLNHQPVIEEDKNVSKLTNGEDPTVQEMEGSASSSLKDSETHQDVKVSSLENISEEKSTDTLSNLLAKKPKEPLEDKSSPSQEKESKVADISVNMSDQENFSVSSDAAVSNTQLSLDDKIDAEIEAELEAAIAAQTETSTTIQNKDMVVDPLNDNSIINENCELNPISKENSSETCSANIDSLESVKVKQNVCAINPEVKQEDCIPNIAIKIKVEPNDDASEELTKETPEFKIDADLKVKSEVDCKDYVKSEPQLKSEVDIKVKVELEFEEEKELELKSDVDLDSLVKSETEFKIESDIVEGEELSNTGNTVTVSSKLHDIPDKNCITMSSPTQTDPNSDDKSLPAPDDSHVTKPVEAIRDSSLQATAEDVHISDENYAMDTDNMKIVEVDPSSSSDEKIISENDSQKDVGKTTSSNNLDQSDVLVSEVSESRLLSLDIEVDTLQGNPNTDEVDNIDVSMSDNNEPKQSSKSATDKVSGDNNEPNQSSRPATDHVEDDCMSNNDKLKKTSNLVSDDAEDNCLSDKNEPTETSKSATDKAEDNFSDDSNEPKETCKLATDEIDDNCLSDINEVKETNMSATDKAEGNCVSGDNEPKETSKLVTDDLEDNSLRDNNELQQSSRSATDDVEDDCASDDAEPNEGNKSATEQELLSSNTNQGDEENEDMRSTHQEPSETNSLMSDNDFECQDTELPEDSDNSISGDNSDNCGTNENDDFGAACENESNYPFKEVEKVASQGVEAVDSEFERNSTKANSHCDSTVNDASSTDDMDSRDCSSIISDSYNSRGYNTDLSSRTRKRTLSRSEDDSCDSFRSKKLNGFSEIRRDSAPSNGVQTQPDSGHKRPAERLEDLERKKLRVCAEESDELNQDEADKLILDEDRLLNSPNAASPQEVSEQPRTPDSFLDLSIENADAKAAASSLSTDLPFLRKLHKKELSKMSRSDLEELVVQKICEAITERSVVGDLRLRCQELEKRQEKEIEKYNKLRKQMTELSLVVKKYMEQQSKNPAAKIIKITRSVGLQVSQTIKHVQHCPSALPSRLPTNPLRPDAPFPEISCQVRTPVKTYRNSTTSPRSSVGLSSSTDSSTQSPTQVKEKANVPVPHKQPTTPSPRLQVPPLQQITGARPRLSIPKTSSPVSAPSSAGPVKAPVPKIQSSPVRNSLPLSANRPPAVNTNSDVEVIDIIDKDDKNKKPGVQISVQQQAHQVKQAANAAAQNLATNSGMTVRLISPSQVSQAGVLSSGFPQLIMSNPSAGVPQKMILASSQGSPIRGNLKLVVQSKPGNVLIPLSTSSGATPPSSVVHQVQQIFSNASIGNKTNTVATVGRQPQPIQPLMHPAPLPTGPPIQTSNPLWKQIPPRPNLKIQHQNNGIVLSWNMALGPIYADIDSYQLYAYQEGSAPPSAGLWKKVGDVKALPLPMACTLTQFVEGHRYHFTVRAVDKHGRVGPFSQQGSIRLGN